MKVQQPDGTPVKTLADAQLAVINATRRYREAKAGADSARSVETAALRDMKEAQRIFDAAVSAERAAAPNDWAEQKGAA